jgi:hypothetical protein
MENVNVFEVATRVKMRFPFKGLISVEDLWDLSVESLDSIYKNLNSQMKQTQEESLLNTKTKQDEEVANQIEIIKYIVGVKQEEAAAKRKAKELKEQKQKIMEIMSAKKDEALQGKSLDELEKMLAEMGN